MLKRKYRFIKPSREYREISILTEIANDPYASQRALARESSLSLAVLNEYLDDLVSRGLVEIEGASPRNYRYKLTPLGVQRRNELFFDVSREIIQFYGHMKCEFRRRLEEHYAQGVRRVVLFGAAETGELVCNASLETPIEIAGIVDNDPEKQGRMLCGLPIRSPGDIAEWKPDAVIITSFGHMDEIHAQLKPMEERGLRILRL